MTKIFRLADLVDLTAIQTMADSHFHAAGIPIGILDAIDGSILVGAGWQDICVKFHRANPTSLQRCLESDGYIKRHLVKGEAYQYQCMNGLWDMAIPIMVKDRHLSTMFFGQVFYEGEIPDREFFIRQAEEFQFDLDAYLKALDQVPVFSREKVDTILEYNKALVAFIASLAENALDKIEMNRTLRLNEERYALAQRVGKIGTWDWDIRSGALYWSEQIEPMFGFAEGEFAATYEAFLGCVHPDDRQRVVDSLNACIEHGADYNIEHRVVWPDKTTRWVAETGTLFRDDKGLPVRMVGVVLDITERKRSQEELQLSEQKYSSVFQMMPDMIGITRMADGRFIEVNAGFERLTGWGKSEVLGHTSVDLGMWEPEVRARAIAIVTVQGSLENYPFVLRIKSGEKRNALIYLAAIKVEGEDCLYFMIRDITERQRAEEKIRCLNAQLEQRVKERTCQLEAANDALATEISQRQQAQEKVELLNHDLQNRSESLELANRELESFSYSVSHDLRAPLRHMAGYSRMILEDYGDKLDGIAAVYLERIEQASSKMGHLIDSLLQLSRISRTELKLQTVDLSSMATEIVTELQVSTPLRSVKIEIAEGLSAMADPMLMRSVLQNLLGNAWKYSRDVSPAVITFRATKKDGKVIYWVRDNGAGFDMTYIHMLFGAFQRLHGHEYEGTGIGLATVQRIIHRHWGTIWAEAELGKGATFYFSLNC